VFVLSVALAVETWRRRQLPVVVGYIATHLAGQAVRLAMGRTSFEAIEIPAASLGLLLTATVVLADADLSAPPAVLAGLGVAAGVLDVVLRDVAVPYAPVLAVMIVTTAIAGARIWRGPSVARRDAVGDAR
jgi:hypothetical protein